MTGLQRTASHFFICCLINILNANAAMGIGLMSASAFPHIGVAMGIMPLLFIPMMVFSGLMVNLKDITPVLSWIQWISPIKYAFAALTLNEFSGLQFQGARFQNGDQVLDSFGITPSPFDLAGNILMQLLFYLACLILAYIVLQRITRKARPKTKAISGEQGAATSQPSL
jgi:ATP-binding cassette subfamily G (WHITE) protein 1